MRKSRTIPTTENAMTATAYVTHRCSDAGVDPDETVDEALDAPVPRVGEDLRHPVAERHVDDREGGDEDGDGEQPADGVAHQKRSAWRRTWTR